MPISSNDRTVLRDLAKRKAEIAALPVMAERKKAWKAHNSLASKHPMILIFPEGANWLYWRVWRTAAVQFKLLSLFVMSFISVPLSSVTAASPRAPGASGKKPSRALMGRARRAGRDGNSAYVFFNPTHSAETPNGRYFPHQTQE